MSARTFLSVARSSQISRSRFPRAIIIVLSACSVLAVQLAAASCIADPKPTPTPTAIPATTTPMPEPSPTAVASAVSPWDRPVSVVSHAEPSLKSHKISDTVIWTSVGATITWHNDDQEDYTVTSDDGWFDATVKPGETFSWQPKEAGMFTYHSTLHDNVSGRIMVAEGGAVAPSYYGGMTVQAYYLDSCSGCHGPERKGATGPALLPETLPDTDEYYHDIILDGRGGTVMPAWKTLGLTEEEAWGLISFLKSDASDEILEWDKPEIERSVQILVDESNLPAQPIHDANLDNLMLVTEREQRSIAMIDGDTHEVVKHIPASYRAHGYTFNPVDERWAYNLGRDGWVFKIDLYSAQAVRRVRIGHDSRGLAISDDGKYLIGGNYLPNTAVIMDAETLEPLKVIKAEGVDPDGNMVDSRICITSDVAPSLVGPYFLIGLKEAGQVWRIDYSKPGFPIVKIKNAGRILHDGFLSPDNRYFYIASQTDNWMTVVDVEKAEVVEMIDTGDTPHPGSGAAWEAHGEIYGATVHAGEGKVTIWNLETNEIVGTVNTSGPGLFLRSHEHSPYVWADALFGKPSNVITVFEKEPPFDEVAQIAEGVMTLHPEFTEDGKFVYVSDWLGNAVRVYDAHSLEKVAEIEGISAPTGIFNASRRQETLGH